MLHVELQTDEFEQALCQTGYFRTESMVFRVEIFRKRCGGGEQFPFFDLFTRPLQQNRFKKPAPPDQQIAVRSEQAHQEAPVVRHSRV